MVRVMTEIYVIDYDEFVEQYEEVNFPKDYFYDLGYEDLERLCEEDIAECLTPEVFEQRFNDRDYGYSGDNYYIRIIEIAEED